jgi:hypothetical protein
MPRKILWQTSNHRKLINRPVNLNLILGYLFCNYLFVSILHIYTPKISRWSFSRFSWCPVLEIGRLPSICLIQKRPSLNSARKAVTGLISGISAQDHLIQRQNARRTTPISDKATLMHRAFPFFSFIFPSLMASVFLICSGCASHTHTHVVRPRLKVQIVSQPTGAKIEINGQYVGDAPVTVDVEASNDGRFWRDTVIKAYPKDTGFTQIRAFNGKSRWAISDMIPPRIFFDTRTEPGAPASP